MSQAREVVFVSGVRTAIGTFGGSLKDIPPTKLGAAVVREAVKRAGVDSAEVGSIVFGHIINTEPKDVYMARVAGVDGGLPIETPALTLNRLCGSGLQAVVSAAQQIMLGDVDIAIAGGAESMSRSPYSLPAQRWGQKMGDAKVIDMLLGTLHDPFGHGHMGVTAENIAAKYQITRDEQDAFALESHKRAAAAKAAGYFKDQILPFEIDSKKGKIAFDNDEHVRTDVTTENLRSLKPVFKKDGTVTPGNASGINDGAAAVVMMAADVAAKKGLKPMARLVGYGISAVEPSEMGIGPVPAVQSVMKRTGLKIADMDFIESNEAFAAQALAVTKNLGFDPAKVNINGGAVALGHPVGATGAILTVKTMYELKRRNAKYALVTLCIGGGQGIAAIFENLN
ncbi:MAG: acetyl-CoA C-acyltransferase family protein [Rhodospirillaceae bacterium]|nr:acetyl-CoA C-acyltransferase family protein [Rhodospirillaceae bacterium]